METKTIQIPEGWIIDKEKSTDAEIVLKEVEKPIERWRDNVNAIIEGYYFDYTIEAFIRNHTFTNVHLKNGVFATMKQAKSALAMARISQIMANDERFGGVVTNEEWQDITLIKYLIYRDCNSIVTSSYTYSQYHLLSFHTPEQRDLFMQENEDLVKEYLMIES